MAWLTILAAGLFETGFAVALKMSHGMTRLWPSLLGAAHVVQPKTILRWHRAGFTAFWR